MEPAEFSQMVQMVREVEVLLGKSEKVPCQREDEMRVLARRSLVVRRPMSKGEVFTIDKINLLRPAQGLPPSFWSKVLGKKANRNLAEGEVLTMDKVEWS